MRASLRGSNDIDETPGGGVVSLIPLQGNVYAKFSFDIPGRHVTFAIENGHRLVEVPAPPQSDHRAHTRSLGEVLDVFGYAALVHQRLFPDIRFVPFVAQRDRQSRNQETALHRPFSECDPVVVGIPGEHLRIGPPPHPSARSRPRCLAHHVQTLGSLELCVRPSALKHSRDATTKGHSMGLS